MNPEDFFEPETQPDGVRTYHRLHLELRDNYLWLVPEGKPARPLQPHECPGDPPEVFERNSKIAREQVEQFRTWLDANRHLLNQQVGPRRTHHLGH
jgi:hypothetical protein